MTDEPHFEQVIQINADTAQIVPLVLSDEEETFLLATTGFEDVRQLRAHILSVQADACQVCLRCERLNNDLILIRSSLTLVSVDSTS